MIYCSGGNRGQLAGCQLLSGSSPKQKDIVRPDMPGRSKAKPRNFSAAVPASYRRTAPENRWVSTLFCKMGLLHMMLVKHCSLTGQGSSVLWPLVKGAS
ncbi:hypothetical protein AALO_G00073200 [Alosa alosa]|uniref:Uncharacterized protein n=1 Tax=Alosa alosa TaxID=278164 RepID=A0AAV6H631_9TELE|nr:hypothetical protein AALO_G00073200 [Alosa alosa]